MKHVFPKIAVDRSQIVYRFSGIRPLPRHDDTAPGFVSRDYRIEEGSLGGTPTLSLVGGKWTTFRALAEHLTNEVLERLGVERAVSTAGLAIGGGKNWPADDAARRAWVRDNAQGLDAARVEQLLERYGTRATEVISAIAGTDDQSLVNDRAYSVGEIAHLVRAEQVVHLDDILLRRTSLAFVGGLSLDLLDEIAGIAAAELGWDDTRRTAEVDAAVTLLRDAHGVVLPLVTPTGA